MREIPKKNYVILSIILLVSGFISLYIMKIFKNNENFDANNKIVFKELKASEIGTYITENSNVIIYYAGNEFKNSKFDKSFRRFVYKNDLINNVIYIDRSKTTTNDYKTFLIKYMNNRDCIIVIDNQEVISIINISLDSNNFSELKKVLKENEVI